MARPRKLTTQDIIDVIRWAQSRKSRKEMAAEKGVSEDTIERIASGYRDRDPKVLEVLKLCG